MSSSFQSKLPARQTQWGFGGGLPPARFLFRRLPQAAKAHCLIVFRTYAVGSFCVTTPHFRLRQHGTFRSFVCGFSARSAEKPHSIEKASTALPKAQRANCVSRDNSSVDTSLIFILQSAI